MALEEKNGIRGVCPLCGETGAQCIGEILHPFPALVAGVEIDLRNLRFYLLACRACGFQFKDPSIPREALMACYEKASGAHWGENVDPIHRYYDVIAEMIERHASGRRILDVGCFNGSLLMYLGDAWSRHGVEPSLQAARLAKERGITILAPQIDMLPSDTAPFDVITAIDVLEHITDPRPFFSDIHRLLKPGGIFLAVTADTESLSWRIQGSRYWYCSLPEHVSFYSPRVMASVGRQYGSAIVEVQRLSHERSRWQERLIQRTKNLGYVAGGYLRGLGVPSLRRLFVERRAPGWTTATDHMFIVMRRARSE